MLDTTETAALAIYDPLVQTWPDETGDLADFIGAIGAVLQQLDTLAHGTIMWSTLVDLDLIPNEGLPWIGQIVGVDVNVNLSPDDQRQQIREHENWNRGTILALKNAVKKYLTGTQTVDIVERDTSAYHFSISTYSDETPPSFSYADLYVDYATYNAFYGTFASYSDYWLSDPRNFIPLVISQNKPAALQFTYSLINGSPGTVTEYLTLFNHHPSYAEVMDSFQTYDDVLTTAY